MVLLTYTLNLIFSVSALSTVFGEISRAAAQVSPTSFGPYRTYDYL